MDTRAMLKRLASDALLRFDCFDRARFLKWRLGRRDERLARQCAIEFYGEFIEPGSLCFDVGANVGSRTDVFWLLGARVVAVEPQPSCIATLRRLHGHHEDVHVVPIAVGSSEGEAELFINERMPVVSTISEAWRDAVIASGRWPTHDWTASIQVRLGTLDNLIAEYGAPDFCKIDVEGSESEVLRGLTRAVPALSFEYTQERFEDVRVCLDWLSGLGPYRFNFSAGESLSLAVESWLDNDQLVAALADHLARGGARSGDIYARVDRLRHSGAE